MLVKDCNTESPHIHRIEFYIVKNLISEILSVYVNIVDRIGTPVDGYMSIYYTKNPSQIMREYDRLIYVYKCKMRLI
jgi:hypothetical protein